MYKTLFLCFFFTLTAHVAAAQTDDAIVISNATEQYWAQQAADGTVSFKNKMQTTYLGERMGGWVQAGTYYGGNITLDANSAGLMNAASYKNMEPRGVFFDDMKVCFYNLQIPRKGKTVSARFERTFTDARFFDLIFLSDDYLTRHKEVEITLPEGYRLLEHHLNEHIGKSQYQNKQGITVHRYTVSDLPADKKEAGMPTSLRRLPCLVVVGAFSDVQALYRWSHELSLVDCHVASLDSLIGVITQGCATGRERLQATYAWVRRNIRYVAFEAGMASHQPDTPAEVLRKRWGDCKGMSLLLRTLLQAQGLDARLTFIGTDDIPWRASDVPALASLNHAICTVVHQGDTLFLDPTTHYLPLDFVPDHLQGREAIVEQSDSCLLLTTPTLPPSASTDSLRYDISIDRQQLSIQATASWSGMLKEMVMRTYSELAAKDKAEWANRRLTTNLQRRQVERCEWAATADSTQTATWARLSGTLTDTKSLLATGNELFIDMNPGGDPICNPIDTTKRVNDAVLPFRCRIVREASLQLPQGCGVSWLPDSITIRLPQGTLSCSFSVADGRVVFRKVADISDKRISRSDIAQWNDALRRWNDAANQQVILETKPQKAP